MADSWSATSLQPGVALTPEQYKEMFIAQRIELWWAKREAISTQEISSRFNLMSGDDNKLPKAKPHVAVSYWKTGGYMYFPNDDDESSDAPGRIQRRQELIWRVHNAPNSEILLKDIEALLDKEIKDKRYLDKDEVPSMNSPYQEPQQHRKMRFGDKVKLIARRRLEDRASEEFGRPDYTDRSRFRFCIANVSRDGFHYMAWRDMDWTTSAHGFSRSLADEDLDLTMSREFPRQFLSHQSRELDTILVPEEVVRGAQALKERLRLQNQQNSKDDDEWCYFLFKPRQKDGRHLEPLLKTDDPKWRPLKTSGDFAAMKTSCKTSDQWPLLMRKWQLRFYETCRSVRRLKWREEKHKWEEEQRNMPLDEDGTPYFDPTPCPTWSSDEEGTT
ncbi:hypothetical protein QBC46DRAFT_423093 [Diplogelasinospora grovesii]|uniref:Uncharacterized protein n=1 Tax=Diplogelasinospora grovesii TaxID=303347 RepID=A0AAN6NFZ4_9PEZI|nr:hypothetical protein QBC46DRAFT_423093 [Diplogelasinospora grovesii]